MPALCHRIHKSKVNPAQYGGQVDINLVGIAIGNGWMSPIEQGKYASYLYYHGLLDGDQYLTLLELEDGLIAKVMIMISKIAKKRVLILIEIVKSMQYHF